MVEVEGVEKETDRTRKRTRVGPSRSSRRRSRTVLVQTEEPRGRPQDTFEYVPNL